LVNKSCGIISSSASSTNILDRARWIQFGTSLKPTIGNTLVFAELAAAMIGAWMWLAR
jgi:hypothetical protein